MQGCKEAGIPCFGTLWDFVSARPPLLPYFQARTLTRLLPILPTRSERRLARISLPLSAVSGVNFLSRLKSPGWPAVLQRRRSIPHPLPT